MECFRRLLDAGLFLVKVHDHKHDAPQDLQLYMNSNGALVHLASSLGIEVDEIGHFRSKIVREEEPHRLVVHRRLDDGEQFLLSMH